MLAELHLAAATCRQVASRPINELAQINGRTDFNGNSFPITYADAAVLRNELIIEARGVEHLSRLIDVRQEILNETIAKLTNPNA